MRVFMALVAALIIGSAPVAQADNHETSDLTALLTAYDAQGWEGVGRLNIGRGGMCTGALISPKVVLTAAHCLYDQISGQLVPDRTITFLAGWRNGRAVATRRVTRAVAHPDYVFTTREGEINVTYDLAVLELASPIRLSNVEPFQTASRPRKGASVGVVSYAHNRTDEPALQKVCHVLARQRGTLVLSCDVDFGSSGAPIFAEVDGMPRIVSVVSAKAIIQGRNVALGTRLEKPLDDLLTLLETAPPTPQIENTVSSAKPAAPGSIVVRRGGNAGGGAKFVKP